MNEWCIYIYMYIYILVLTSIWIYIMVKDGVHTKVLVYAYTPAKYTCMDICVQCIEWDTCTYVHTYVYVHYTYVVIYV